jgi:hypothetical protein
MQATMGPPRDALRLLVMTLVILNLIGKTTKSLCVGSTTSTKGVTSEISAPTRMYVQWIIAEAHTLHISTATLTIRPHPGSTSRIRANRVPDVSTISAPPSDAPAKCAAKSASPCGSSAATQVELGTSPPSPDQASIQLSNPKANPIVPQAPVTRCLDRWRSELLDDPDRDFILEGIEFGFKLVDEQTAPPPTSCDNYSSATRDFKTQVEKQITAEIDQGRYIVCEKPPKITSALGAIPKTNDRIRLIHDFSRPSGGLNQFCSDSSVVFPTLDEAVSHISDNSYLAKIDLHEAYRSIPLHESCFCQTGLKWKFQGQQRPTYMFDSRLPFGATRSCKIFQTLTDAIVRMLAKKNITTIGYIDDFLLICDNLEHGTQSLNTIVELVEGLGFTVNWQKVAGPARIVTFLGVEVNCNDRTLSLPQEKLCETRDLIQSWLGRKKATKKDLQRVIGKLNWCCRVIVGGRTFTRNLINLITKVNMPHHFIRLGLAAREDLIWWAEGLEIFNGTAPFPSDIPLPSSSFSTDACLTGGGGAYMGDWFYSNWAHDLPSMVQSNINVLELQSVLLGVRRWAHLWVGCHILVRSDNSSTVYALNKTSSRSPEMLAIIKEIFWYSIKYGFKISAAFIPGKLNIISDRISRLHELQSAHDAFVLLNNGLKCIPCIGHMSKDAFLYLQKSWPQA